MATTAAGKHAQAAVAAAAAGRHAQAGAAAVAAGKHAQAGIAEISSGQPPLVHRTVARSTKRSQAALLAALALAALTLAATPALAQPAEKPEGAQVDHAAPSPSGDTAKSADSAPVPSVDTAKATDSAPADSAKPGEPGDHAEAKRASAGAAGDPGTAREPGSEHHTGGPSEEDAEEVDPSKHFNFVGQKPGHLFDYSGKDEFGGPFGDGKMVDTQTGQVLHEEEPASPPFVFVLINFAILLGLLAWKGWPLARQTAQERHDLIKTALEEAARLRKQAADKLAEYESRLKAADAEITQLVAGMRADADAEKQRILAAAAAQAAQMKRDAEQRIAAEIELARARLTREVTAAAAAATEALLREKLTARDQQQLVATFISDVQGAVAGQGPTRPGAGGEVR